MVSSCCFYSTSLSIMHCHSLFEVCYDNYHSAMSGLVRCEDVNPPPPPPLTRSDNLEQAIVLRHYLILHNIAFSV